MSGWHQGDSLSRPSLEQSWWRGCSAPWGGCGVLPAEHPLLMGASWLKLGFLERISPSQTLVQGSGASLGNAASLYFGFHV